MKQNEIKKMKEQFKKSQENGSPLWQDVISFNNSFLESINVYDSKTGYLDEKKIKNITREVIKTMAENEDIDMNTLVWNGAVHYNTDNIHIHIASTQAFPDREKVFFNNKLQYRGNRKPKTFEKMKRTVAYNLYNRNKDLQKIDELIRTPVQQKRNTPLKNHKDFEFHFHKALDKLPDDKKQWQYGYNTVNFAREHIDAISNKFMENYYPNELKELDEMLDKQVDIANKLYGDSSKAENYKQNKMQDLYKRLGNAVLKELKDYDKETKNNSRESNNIGDLNTKFSFKNIKAFAENQITKESNSNNRVANYRPSSLSKLSFETSVNIAKLNRAMRKTYHDFKKEQDMNEFDMMQEGIEIE